MKTPLVILLTVAAGLMAGMTLFLPADARGEFYKYKDSSGNLIITNRLEDVPRKYRSRVKVIWDEELEAKDPLARRNAAAERDREQREAKQSKQVRQKAVENKKSDDDKVLVITIDPDTGEVIRRFE